MEPLISHRMARVKPSPTLAMAARAAELKLLGQDVIGLGTGEPDFDTPDHIKKAAIKALSEGKTKYTAVEGILPLRKAIVEKFKRENEIEYMPDQIIVGMGAKQVIFNALLASLNPGDEVIIPAPYWVSYPDMVELAEGTPVMVRCLPENNLKLTPKSLALALKTFPHFHNILRRYSGVALVEKEIFLPEKLSCLLVGTPFQHQVWTALLDIPEGKTWSYQQLANHIHKPKAVRAVANAVGANPISPLIPCHRVIRSNHQMGGYYWGVDAKLSLLKQEGVDISGFKLPKSS